MVDYTSPLNVAFVGPSIVPITGNNAGWRVYQVDAKTFNVLDHQTYFANISQSHYWTDPVWNFEYDARTIYDPLQKWGANHPLNATFWHNISSQMLNNGSLVSLYNFLETKVIYPGVELICSRVWRPRIVRVHGVSSRRFVISGVVRRHWDIYAGPAMDPPRFKS